MIKFVKLKSPDFDNLLYLTKPSLASGHWSSIYGGLKTWFNRSIYNNLVFERRIFKMSDGAELAIDSNPGQTSDRPLIVILPGLNSCNQDEYVHTLIKASMDNGYDWTLINYRGMTHPLTTPFPFSTSDFDSFNQALADIIKRNAGKQIFVVGSSLGGNVLANIL